MIVGKGAKSTSVAATTLHREFNIPPVLAFCGGQQCRALEKYGTAPTWVGDLVNNIPARANAVNAKWLWTTRTTKLMKRYLACVPSKAFRAREWDKWVIRHPYILLASYMSLRFYRTRGFLLECDRVGLNTKRNETLLVLARIEGCGLPIRSKVRRAVSIYCAINPKGDPLFPILL